MSTQNPIRVCTLCGDKKGEPYLSRGLMTSVYWVKIVMSSKLKMGDFFWVLDFLRPGSWQFVGSFQDQSKTSQDVRPSIQDRKIPHFSQDPKNGGHRLTRLP